MSKFNAKEISDFARYYGFHYDNYNYNSLIKDILIEMERGLAGKPSSLPMLPSYITPVSRISPGKTVLALDAGGTNLRCAIIQFDENGEAVQQGITKTKMPGTNGQVSAQQFFDAIADAALPLLNENKIEGIGFTFSYPIEITNDADGILISFSKEVDAPEVIGKAIGQGLRESLAGKGFKYNGPIVLLNDTAATLLSGYVSISPNGEKTRSRNDFDVHGGPAIGFILGTGFNSAYPETYIPKIGYDNADSPQIINCETGNFSIRDRGQLDREFDNTTKNPGRYTLEKSVAGAYLGPLTLHFLKQAIKDKVLNFARSDELLAASTLGTSALNEFLNAPLTAEGPLGSLFSCGESDAIAAVQYIASIAAERGAMFSAAVLAATVKKINCCFKPFAPVRIAVDGSTFMLFKGISRSIESFLHQMLLKDKPIPYVISPVEQASLFGAAAAALSK